MALPALAGTVLLAGCGGDYSTLDPAGPASRSVATLWWVMLAGASVLTVGVGILLVLAATGRLRGRAGRPRALILWGGLVMPVIVLSALVGAAFVLGEALLPKPQEPEPLRIEVIARQWVWEFHYPDEGSTTLDRLHIPVGRDIDFTVTSEDVIHSFWIPRLGGKIDAIPGHTNTIRLHADRAGRFGGICAEFCGDGHAVMRFEVIAHEGDGFAEALRGLGQGEAP